MRVRASRLVVSFVACACLVTPALGSAECVDYRDYMHWAGTVATPGSVKDVAVSGDYAYVATTPSGAAGVSLHVFAAGLSATFPPRILGSVDLPQPYQPSFVRVAAAGGFAYVITFYYPPLSIATLQIVDATDPEHPSAAGEMPLGDAYGIAAAGSHVFVIHGWSSPGIEVIDVSDPWSPRSVASVETYGTSHGLVVSGGRIYVATEEPFYPHASSLQVIDVSDPLHPEILGDVPVPVGPVVVSGRYAYVAAEEQLFVIDVSDPRDPRIVNQVTVGGIAGMTLCDAHIFATGVPFRAIDVSDPVRPRVLGEVDLGPYAGGNVAAAGPFAYAADERLHVISVSSCETRPILGSVETPGFVRSVALEGDHAYVAAWHGGLQVVDVSNPAAPEIVGQLPLGNDVADVAVRGSLAYLALTKPTYGPYGGFAVVDVSRPQDPRELARLNLPYGAYGVFLQGSRAYLFAGLLTVVDIQDPRRPTLVSATALPVGGARGMALSPTHAFIVSQTAPDYPYVYKLFAVNISNQNGIPFIQGALTLPRFANGVALTGHYALVRGSGIQVVDVEHPGQMKVVHWADSPGNPGNDPKIVVAGGLAYSSTTSSVEIFDVTRPESARFLASVPGGRGGLALTEDQLYALRGYDLPANPDFNGLTILSTQCPMIWGD